MGYVKLLMATGGNQVVIFWHLYKIFSFCGVQLAFSQVLSLCETNLKGFLISVSSKIQQFNFNFRKGLAIKRCLKQIFLNFFKTFEPLCVCLKIETSEKGRPSAFLPKSKSYLIIVFLALTYNNLASPFEFRKIMKSRKTAKIHPSKVFHTKNLSLLTKKV